MAANVYCLLFVGYIESLSGQCTFVCIYVIYNTIRCCTICLFVTTVWVMRFIYLVSTIRLERLSENSLIIAECTLDSFGGRLKHTVEEFYDRKSPPSKVLMLQLNWKENTADVYYDALPHIIHSR
uniref:Uncharacterized protein n=1 Tax=Glossina brevipalpis TaxID=37001 RepID=A0A1A9W255_9MUSC